MTIENIRCFIRLAECLNFTKAAEKEHITQTSMSRKISSIEAELGVLLFYRDNRLVTLTSAGKEFYYQSLKMIELYEHSVNNVQNIHDGFIKELKIGVGLYEDKLLSYYLNSYVEQNPTVKISCMQFSYYPLLQQLQQNLLDVILTSDQFFNEIPLESVEIYPIQDQDWKLGVYKKNPLAKRDKIPFSCIEQEVLITMYEGSASQVIDHHRHHFEIKDYIYVNSYETKVMMVNANLGVGLFPAFLPVEEYTDICLKPFAASYKPRKFYIVCKKSNPSRFVHEFAKNCAEHLQALPPF